MDKFIRSFTYTFHPLFIPVYATLFYLVVTAQYFQQFELYLIFVQVLILTVLLPMSIFYLLKSLGKIKSKVMLDKKERRLPLAFYALLLFILIKHSFSTFTIPELYYYFLGMLISTLAALALVLFGHKASLHMMGISSLLLFVMGLSIYYSTGFLYVIAFLIICSGFVASARLEVKAHNATELIAGTLLGILPQAGLWYIWLLPTL